jgi:hypothetical protein
MAIDIRLLFTAAGVAKSVAEFSGLLDAVETKVGRLVQAELNTGLRALDQAARATAERESLLREARGCFNKAASLEVGYRRVVALLGLSLCHHWLDDRPNCTRALEEILEVNPISPSKLVMAAGRDYVRNLGVVYGIHWLGRGERTVHPGLIVSGRARQEYKRKMVLEAVDTSEEATAIRFLQEAVSRHVGKPVAWLKALE